MSIDAKEAFKLGFLTRCAEEGLIGAALTARLEKIAQFNEKAAGVVADVTNAGLTVAGLPLGAALLAGGGLGWGAAKLTAPKLDDDEMKNQELVNTYKVMAARAKAQRKLRAYRGM